MLAVDPLHRKCTAPGVTDVLDLPVHAEHVDVGVPRFTFHSPSGFGGIAALLTKEWTVGHSMDSDHALAGAHEFLNCFLGSFPPARPVIILHQKIVVGERRRRDA